MDADRMEVTYEQTGKSTVMRIRFLDSDRVLLLTSADGGELWARVKGRQ